MYSERHEMLEVCIVDAIKSIFKREGIENPTTDGLGIPDLVRRVFEVNPIERDYEVTVRETVEITRTYRVTTSETGDCLREDLLERIEEDDCIPTSDSYNNYELCRVSVDEIEDYTALRTPKLARS
jgi:hypothetical protein